VKRKGRRTCPGSTAAKEQRRAHLEAWLIVGPRRRGRRRASTNGCQQAPRVGWMGWCICRVGEGEGSAVKRWRCTSDDWCD
jgi:hypothetical protein